ncbi:Triphosphoribosyl-dephospho-CoA synthase [Alkaliphilus metalliredigens QYMF]|uniref:Probable 2-(5''-triphosphoribosyl)-3'-dephosphocoenzyme-A synthase n=1 Tax=Alkaliphilus metalliredigens (strain QYMF) TaxID=293826 RepID=A6TTL8_ALKMQ|nr:triphosphoribosyl-dephospho-CoA synthase CitG [Alkaliphilus metalliredigens]ABR49536.1 Triphosphoribosyl-dephospho-CoA synthase [Alkaliphilus metalliredigens QYMF]
MKEKIVSSEFNVCEYISELALKSMLFEVSATPKPGLVDRHNSGAHQDMDFYLFLESSGSLVHTFHQCALAGFNFGKRNSQELLEMIRPIGIAGENKMFAATKGVNTHKGLIFSLGIISAAAGVQYRERQSQQMNIDEICHKIKAMTEGISKKELEDIKHHRTDLTYGERLFKNHGVKGIRGEVESGFNTVRTYSLPILRELMKGNQKTNDILVQVLFHLMEVTEDSNVLGRHDLTTLKEVKTIAKDILSVGGMFTEEGRKKIVETDKQFIEGNISPGGSADLLAVTLMLYFLEKP